MAFAFVQGTHFGDSSAGSTIAATGSAVASGNVVVGIVTWITAGTNLSSVTDDKGNTYNLDTPIQDFGAACTFSLGNITNAPSTITANFSAASGGANISWAEYSGASAVTDPRDGATGQEQLAPGSGTDVTQSGNITTTVDGDLIVGLISQLQSQGGLTAGTGFTLETACSDTTAFVEWVFIEDKVQATHGSVQTTFSQSNAGATDTFVIAIKPAAGGGATLNTAWLPPSPERVARRIPTDTRPAISLTPATLPPKVAGMAWFERQVDIPPKKRPLHDFRPAISLTPATLPPKVAGMAWFEPPDRDRKKDRSTVEAVPAWDPQPIGVVVTAPPNGWITTPVDQLRRKPPIDQPTCVQFTPPQTTGWPQLAQDRLWPKFRLPETVPAWSPTAPTPQAIGWWMLAQDRLPLRLRLLLDVPAINLTPPATPSTIDGIAWFEPFDRLPRVPVPAPRDAAPAFGFPVVDTSAGITGMAWFEPWDRDKRSVRVTIEASPAISLTPDTLPVGIFGMSWFAPPDRDRPRFTPTVETFPAWGPQFIVQVAPPPSTGGDDFLVLARRRGRR